MKYLVGSTGFVGSNLAGSTHFDGRFHSTDVERAYGARPELLVYAGLSAEKYLANHEPGQDMAKIHQAFENMVKIDPSKPVLISTVDVYARPVDVDEGMPVDPGNLQAYGLNRYRLEEMVRARWPQALIVRLPGLYGENLKKNFLFDLIHRIPTMLKPEQFQLLRPLSPLMEECYALGENGFYRVKPLPREQRRQLRAFFLEAPFSALHFTDSRAVYQMYPLRFLWRHISAALEQGLGLLNIAVEPIPAQEIYQAIEHKPFQNELSASPAHYRMKSLYASQMGGENGYLFGKAFLLEDIAAFVQRERQKLEACEGEK